MMVIPRRQVEKTPEMRNMIVSDGLSARTRPIV
jgi:hypothetical protein